MKMETKADEKAWLERQIQELERESRLDANERNRYTADILRELSEKVAQRERLEA